MLSKLFTLLSVFCCATNTVLADSYSSSGAHSSSQTFPLWRAAIAAEQAPPNNGSHNAYLQIYSDSTFAGYNLPNFNDGIGGQVRVALAARLPSAGVAEGLVYPSTGLMDPRWTLGSGWSSVGGVLGPGGREGAFSTAAGSSIGATGNLSFAPGYTIDTFIIWYGSYGQVGVSTVNVDGGAPLTSTGGTAGLVTDLTTSYKKLVFKVTKGTHTINISGPNAGTIEVLGIMAYDSTVNHIFVSNLAITGACAETFTNTDAFGDTGFGFWISYFGNSTTTDATPQPAGFPCNLNLTQLLINNANQNPSPPISLSTWTTDTQGLITTTKAAPSDLLLNNPIPKDPTYLPSDPYSTYTAVYVSLATGGVGYNDSTTAFVSFANGNALGYYIDVIHPSVTGAPVAAAGILTSIP